MEISPNSARIAKLNLNAPLPLDPKNFTSINRTPWAGSALAAGIKRNQANNTSQKIGESWEVSCDPDSPSKLRDDPSITLPEVIAQRAAECLSEQLVASGRTSCDILIKLLNADSPLSLQIHPSDSNQFLKLNECGKPESWLVLETQKDGGIYLGFKKEITVTEIKERLTNGTFSSDLLQFVPVKKGDYFEIEPHVPHAIGPGVILLEPQRIIAGKSGKTWRLWDWNRKYNSAGQLDAENGKPRDLHIDEAIPLLDPAKQSGPGYVASLLKSATTCHPMDGVTLDIFPSNPWYQTISVQMRPHTKMRIQAEACYGCLTMLHGSVSSTGKNGDHTALQQGESYFIPAVSLPIDLATKDNSAQFTVIIPAGQGIPERQLDQIKSIFC